jgi:hypothetical protein
VLPSAILMNRSSLCAISIAALSAVGCEDPPPPLFGTLPAPEPVLSKDGFCKLVYGAPRRHLDAHCSADEKAVGAYGYLRERSTRLASQCIDDWALGGSVGKGRVQLPLSTAIGCAEALERLSWKTTLLTNDLSRIPACAKLIVGTQRERAACDNSLDCQPGLWCDGAKPGREGRCRLPAAKGQPCGPSDLGPNAPIVSSCLGGSYCGVRATRSPAGAPVGRHAVRGPTGALPDSGGREVRRQASERVVLHDSGPPIGPLAGPWHELDKAYGHRVGVFGGSLDSLAAGGYFIGGRGLSGLGGHNPASDDGIGLKNIGAIGHGGAPQGFGSGGARPRSPGKGSPRASFGAVNANGPLPPGVVRRILAQNFSRFRLCYEQGLEGDPQLKGRVGLRFVIGRDGRAANVGGGGDMPDSVVTCVTRSLKGLHFPEPDGAVVTVSVPIVFTPATPPEPAPSSAASGAPAAGASASAAGSAPGYDTAPPSPAVSPNLCIAVKKLGNRCTATAQCTPGMTCRASECRKRRLAVAGGRCDGDGDCTAGLYCDKTCRKVKPTGEDCESASQCAGACGADGKCVALCGAG